ncbi:hypothetical protein [Comamonas thiooxydans]|uniref:hypothetical protein n=1 Tax=Comamonas thiooxydans TaxID=363952 RepID=UPI001A93EBD2|nr:hypothetical protein [Comamonas thiooxydans]
MWDLYKLSYKFPTSKPNIIFFILSLALLLIYCYCVEPSVAQVAGNLRVTLSFGASLAPGIIGFLVAGFTIFVTITKVELFNFMAIKRYKNTNESYLKYNMSAFMLAFIHYCAYIFTCAILVIFAQPNGPLILVVKFIFNEIYHYTDKNYYLDFLKIFFSFFGAWSIYLILLLKTFVYNIYQVLCTTVRWSIESDNQKKARKRTY